MGQKELYYPSTQSHGYLSTRGQDGVLRTELVQKPTSEPIDQEHWIGTLMEAMLEASLKAQDWLLDGVPKPNYIREPTVIEKLQNKEPSL
jgi:hypothetical protein